MSEEKRGFQLRYASARALQRDHAAHFAKGQVMVASPAGAPAPGTVLAIRIEAPDATLFELRGRAGQAFAGRGFTVALDAGPDRARAALDMFVRGDRFRRLVAGEKPADLVEPVTTMVGEVPLEAHEEPTDPGARLVPDTEEVDEEGLGQLIDALDGVGELTAAAEAGGDVLESDTNADDGADDGPEEVMPEGFRKPSPGEEYVVYVVKFPSVRAFAAIRDNFRNTQRLELDYKEEPARKGKVAQLRLTLPGHNIYKMFGFIANVTSSNVVLSFDPNNENFRQANLYIDAPAARNRMKNEDPEAPVAPEIIRMLEVVPEEDPDKLPIRRRLQRMGMDDKINLALSGGREERMALAMDGNKAIHHYLLRNAKISLDEIAFMARLPTMNPDVLDKIAENPSYTQNPTVVKALVYNPKTPVPTAIRLLDRLPRAEVLNLAKRTNMNMRLVMAAKKKIEGKRW